ncbi:hypothetical protein LG329_16365 [Virgibacillus necropolis]|uniref:hypothetical protein n=1 Tax=Virgibacillus necropolis TaxID=163877 RepID=UPI00384ABADE
MKKNERGRWILIKLFIRTGFIIFVCVLLTACGDSHEYSTHGEIQKDEEDEKDETYTPRETDVI